MKHRTINLLIAVGALSASLACAVTSSPATPTAGIVPAAASPVWGHQTKTSGCQVAGARPDPACTPGDVLPNVTKDQICQPGYSTSVRDVPDSEKNQVYAEYGVTSHTTGQYEVDHFVSLELGGSNDISNLWPEAADPTPGFHQKDLVENYLHEQVCQGAMTLADAQVAIATDWLAVYSTMTGGGQVAPPPTVEQPVATAPLQGTAPAAGFTLTQLTSPVARGAIATVTIQTIAGANCAIDYVTPAGTHSTVSGLGPQTANTSGVCNWAWRIGTSTKPGTGTVKITANGLTQDFPLVVQ